MDVDQVDDILHRVASLLKDIKLDISGRNPDLHPAAFQLYEFQPITVSLKLAEGFSPFRDSFHGDNDDLSAFNSMLQAAVNALASADPTQNAIGAIAKIVNGPSEHALRTTDLNRNKEALPDRVLHAWEFQLSPALLEPECCDLVPLDFGRYDTWLRLSQCIDLVAFAPLLGVQAIDLKPLIEALSTNGDLALVKMPPALTARRKLRLPLLHGGYHGFSSLSWSSRKVGKSAPPNVKAVGEVLRPILEEIAEDCRRQRYVEGFRTILRDPTIAGSRIGALQVLSPCAWLEIKEAADAVCTSVNVGRAGTGETVVWGYEDGPTRRGGSDVVSTCHDAVTIACANIATDITFPVVPKAILDLIAAAIVTRQDATAQQPNGGTNHSHKKLAAACADAPSAGRSGDYSDDECLKYALARFITSHGTTSVNAEFTVDDLRKQLNVTDKKKKIRGLDADRIGRIWQWLVLHDIWCAPVDKSTSKNGRGYQIHWPGNVVNRIRSS